MDRYIVLFGTRFGARALVAFGALAAFSLGLLLFWVAPQRRAYAVDEWRARLVATANDRALMVDEWASELMRDTEVLGLTSSVNHSLSAVTATDSERERATALLRNASRASGYSSAILIDARAAVIASTGPAALDQDVALLARAVLEAGAPRIRISSATTEPVVIAGAPVVGIDGTATGAVIVTEPASILFTIMTREAVPTRTGETQLIEREADAVRFLSPLRKRQADFRRLRVPVDDSSRPAAAALAGVEGFAEYEADYAGDAVFAATVRLESVPWGVVAKIDRDEALALWRSESFVLLLALAGLLCGIVGFSFWRLRQIEGDHEARYRRLFDQASEAIFFTRPDGRITDLNPAGRALFELGDVPLDDMSAAELYQDPADRERFRAEMDSYGMIRNFEVRLRTRSGRPFYGLYSAVAARDGAGRVIGYQAFVRDITERKQAQDALERSQERLETRVAERTAELEAANRELEAFAYSVSHDLRAPLRSMDGFSLALLEDYASVLDTTGSDYLKRIRAASVRMSGLIDDLLTLSRATRGDMNREEVDLTAIAIEVVTELRRAFPTREVEVAVESDMSVRADPRMMRIVLDNLIGNAWKFTAGKAHGRIEVKSEETDRGRAFIVRDNGAGFDMTYAAKLFTPFQRLHRNDEFSGNGIGLATVQRVLHRHGGAAWATAEPGAGATFFFTVTHAGAPAATEPQTPRPLAAALN